ncbi:hypothetical protein JT305_15245 [Salmonella enterica subsp. enterica serovar Senftenberg]|nr:hypothetical protein [Salmonella enterica subsp. enterica serovar Senftenberg]
MRVIGVLDLHRSNWPNGTTVKHVAVAPETSAVIANGGCINSGGGVCEQQPAQQAE